MGIIAIWLSKYGVQVITLVAIGFVINVPLGVARAGVRKYSLPWFVYIHLSIPLLFLLRRKWGLSLWAIPFSLSSAIAGQIAGGIMRQHLCKHKIKGAESDISPQQSSISITKNALGGKSDGTSDSD